MSRDYAKKNRSSARRRSPAKRQLPAWLWLLVGGILGAFVTFLVYLWGIAPPPSTKGTSKPKPEKADTRDAKTSKPYFYFYDQLPEGEVLVPATAQPRTSKKEPSETASTEAMEYIFQVGSFAKQADADRLRAQLIMLNLDVRIEKASIRNGEIWHRVMVGPFTDQARLDSARSTLVTNQYNALMLKRKRSE